MSKEVTRLAIVKIQRPLFTTGDGNECLFYEVDPSTLDRIGFPTTIPLKTKEIKTLFEEDEEESFDKVYYLVLINNHNTVLKFIDPVLIEEWE